MRGIHLAREALNIWPELAKDGAKEKSDTNKSNWAEFDNGARAYFDATKPKIYAIRDDHGAYTLATSGKDEELITTDRAMVGCSKTECPTLHAILRDRKTEIVNYLADKRRDLRDSVKKALAEDSTESSTRGANKTFAEWFESHLESARKKVRAAKDKAECDAAKLTEIAEWLERGARIMGK